MTTDIAAQLITVPSSLDAFDRAAAESILAVTNGHDWVIAICDRRGRWWSPARSQVNHLIDDALWHDPSAAQAVGYAAIERTPTLIRYRSRDQKKAMFAARLPGDTEWHGAGCTTVTAQECVAIAVRHLGGQQTSLSVWELTASNRPALPEPNRTAPSMKRLRLQPITHPADVAPETFVAFTANDQWCVSRRLDADRWTFPCHLHGWNLAATAVGSSTVAARRIRAAEALHVADDAISLDMSVTGRPYALRLPGDSSWHVPGRTPVRFATVQRQVTDFLAAPSGLVQAYALC